MLLQIVTALFLYEMKTWYNDNVFHERFFVWLAEKIKQNESNFEIRGNEKYSFDTDLCGGVYRGGAFAAGNRAGTFRIWGGEKIAGVQRRPFCGARMAPPILEEIYFLFCRLPFSVSFRCGIGNIDRHGGTRIGNQANGVFCHADFCFPVGNFGFCISLGQSTGSENISCDIFRVSSFGNSVSAGILGILCREWAICFRRYYAGRFSDKYFGSTFLCKNAVSRISSFSCFRMFVNRIYFI
jgi:hypothetical protein